MAPENAQIYYVEDDQDSREITEEFLEMAGHKIVETASSRQEALDKIPHLKEMGVDVAIVDGNLTETDASGRDGEAIAKAIREQQPDIIVIGHALEKPIANANYNSTKYEGSMHLAELVTKV